MSEPPQRKSKKRKSTALEENVQIVLEEPMTTIGPAFVSFPAIRPSKNTPFSLYARDLPSEKEITKQRTILAGETEDMNFHSTNRDFSAGGEAQDCQYMPALYDPSTRTLTIHPTAPTYLMTHRVKRLVQQDLALRDASDAEARAAWRQKRNNLGEAFGTRKAKSQIKAEERNRVDVGAMQGVKGHLMDSIAEAQAVEETIPPPESIPVPDLTTSNPLEVYPQTSLIPDDEWSAISVSELIRAPDDRSRLQMLPWSKGPWFNSKVRAAMTQESSDKRRNMKYLYYLSSLHAFLGISKILPKLNSSETQKKLAGVPVQIINGLLTRFTESSGKSHVVTDKMKAKALAWVCCLYLVVDGGSTEIGKVAKDLGMTDAKVQTIFKSLGCTVDVASPAEREQLGISLAKAQENKRAVLKAPVKFPKTGRRGPVKR